jgi:hypothetical protein
MKLQLFFLFVSTVYSWGSASIILSPGQDECFFQDLAEFDRLDASFVIEAQNQNQKIDFYIKHPAGGILKAIKGETSGSLSVESNTNGQFDVCFKSSYASNDVELTFNIYGPDEQKKYEKTFVRHDEAHRAVSDEIQFLVDKINLFKEQQIYLIRRANTHAKTVESTHSRVVLWSLLQFLLVTFSCLFQVYYLKR